MKIYNHSPKYVVNPLVSIRTVLWQTALICCLSIPGNGQQTNSNGIKEVEKVDYEVYTSFFTTEKLPAIEIPQFFEYAAKTRKIYANTVIAKDLKPDELAFLRQSFGEQFNSLYENYRKNNRVEYLVKDRIRVPDLSILSKEQKEKMFSGKLVEVPSHLTGEYVSLSRVGFNIARNTALFHLSWSGSASTSYFVKMQKQNNRWVIVKVEMDDMIIF